MMRTFPLLVLGYALAAAVALSAVDAIGVTGALLFLWVGGAVAALGTTLAAWVLQGRPIAPWTPVAARLSPGSLPHGTGAATLRPGFPLQRPGASRIA